MLTWCLHAERSRNILNLAPSTVTWHTKWAQSILQNFYQEYFPSILDIYFNVIPINYGFTYYDTCWRFFFGTNQHLETVIRQRIPSIIALINKTIDELNAELDRIGRPIGGEGGVYYQSIYIYQSTFIAMNEIVALF